MYMYMYMHMYMYRCERKRCPLTSSSPVRSMVRSRGAFFQASTLPTDGYSVIAHTALRVVVLRSREYPYPSHMTRIWYYGAIMSII